jgi:CelD/BcsL family acetyltransferase involved in cellulose biosynthesis
MNTALISSTEQFVALQREWNELLGASSAESPFLTWEWLYSWWGHLRETRQLAVVTVRNDGELVALVPFCASGGAVPFLRRWELMGTGFAGSDYLDAIVRRGFEAEALRAIAGVVRTHDMTLHLRHLAPDSFLSKLTPELAEHAWTVRQAADGVCPYIRLEGHTWDSFLATLGPSNRATTRRRLRSLDRKFRMQFGRIDTDALKQLALARLFDFHDARFGKQGTAFRTPALCSFHREATERLHQSGLLRLYALYLDGALAAVMYGIAFRNRFYFYQHGYDPRFQSHGIGRALLDMSIRAAIEEGLAEFDLLYGSETYKSAWTSTVRPLTRIDLFPAHLGGRLHQRTVETERTLRAFARRVVSIHVPQTN